jgi:hypothetical protein
VTRHALIHASFYIFVAVARAGFHIANYIASCRESLVF